MVPLPPPRHMTGSVPPSKATERDALVVTCLGAVDSHVWNTLPPYEVLGTPAPKLRPSSPHEAGRGLLTILRDPLRQWVVGPLLNSFFCA